MTPDYDSRTAADIWLTHEVERISAAWLAGDITPAEAADLVELAHQQRDERIRESS